MDFTPTKDAEVAEFLRKARKGLRYGEDLFLAIYVYTENLTPEDVVKSFFDHLLTIEADKKIYGRFLIRKNILADLRTRITMPGFYETIKEVPREQVYKWLAQHLPASDMFDLIGNDIHQQIYLYKLVSAEGLYITSEESGHTLFLFVNPNKQLALLHTIFT